jgi:lipopolysaccharide transport system ATP-binding protein
MPPIKVDAVAKAYKHYTRTSFYLRDQLTALLSRVSPFSRGARREPDSFWALLDVSFEVEPGEALGIIGRNGAGKSTILKLLAGVSRPTAGSVITSGRIAPLIEVGAGFHPELTGRENVYLNGCILGMRKADIDRRFDSIISFAELEDFVDMPIKHYSSGMYVRLGFAIAAHTDPDIYLIDEVLAVGDAAFQEKCLAHLSAEKGRGKTMVLVSHNLPVIEQFCDRAICLSAGRVHFEGAPDAAVRSYLATIRSVSPSTTGGHLDSVRLLGSNGLTVTEVPRGGDVTIEVRYHLQADVPRLVVGFGLETDEHQHVLAFNTATSGFRPDGGRGDHLLTCEIEAVSLPPGRYHLSVYLHPFAGSNLHVHHRGYPVTVVSHDTRPGGSPTLSARWLQLPIDASPQPVPGPQPAEPTRPVPETLGRRL